MRAPDVWSTLVDKTRRFVDSTLLLSLAAAFCYWASFPPLSVRIGAWLVPVFWACVGRRLISEAHCFQKADRLHKTIEENSRQSVDFREQKVTAEVLFKVWISGYLCWLGLLNWMCQQVWWMIAAWMASAALLAFFWVAFIWLSATATVRYRLPQPLAMAIVWCGLEWCRKNLLLGGFPFAALEHSQYRNTLLIQIADVFGEYGLGFVMMIVGGCAANFILGRAIVSGEKSDTSALRWRLTYGCAGLSVFVSLLGYGVYRLPNAHSEPALNVPSRTIALLQGTTDLTDVTRPSDIERAFEECRALSIRYGGSADLVVWPEGVCALRWADVEPGYTPAEWRDQSNKVVEKIVEQARSSLSQPLIDLAIASHAPLLLNLPVRDYRSDGSGSKLCPTNSVLYVDPVRGIGARYDKMKLAPFIECDPVRCVIDRDVFFRSWFRRGNRAVAFPIPRKSKPADDQGRHGGLPAEATFHATVNVCYDSMFPHIIRRQLADLHRQGVDPDVVINVSNDADSSCTNAQDMHLATHVFRAVESRKPYLVASNSGASAWIDCYGQIVCQGAAGSSGCVIATVSRTDERGVYRNMGDIIPVCCAWIAGLLIPVHAVFRRFVC